MSNNVPTGRKIIPYPPSYRVKPVGYSGFGYPLPSLVGRVAAAAAGAGRGVPAAAGAVETALAVAGPPVSAFSAMLAGGVRCASDDYCCERMVLPFSFSRRRCWSGANLVVGLGG